MGLLQNQKWLINTQDFNYDGILNHSITNNMNLAIELIFNYIDE